MNPSTMAHRHSACAGALCALLLASACQAFSPGFGEVGGERVRELRDRTAQQDAMLELRLELLLPRVMAEAGIDCWLVVSDGRSADPAVAWLTVSATHPEGTVALLLCRDGAGLQRFALGRGLTANDALYEIAEPSDEAALEDLINERLAALDPQRIAIDDARSFAAADGLSASDARWLRERLAGDLADRLVSSRPLVEDFLATQLDVEAPLFAESARLTAAILDEVLSDRVVVAAGTSLADLDWAVRTRAAAIHAELAFPPRTLVYRPASTLEDERRMGMDLILQPGDLVFLTAGIDYLGYAQRVGRWAYLLPSGERSAPAWIGEALGTLADAAERVAAGLSTGQDAGTVQQGADAAIADLVDGRARVDRVGRLREGAIDPWRLPAVTETWRPGFRLAADTGLTITVQAAITPPAATPRPFTLVTVDTARLTVAGARLVLPPQRTPLLID